MNYAILGPRDGINRICNTTPSTETSDSRFVEVTDEQTAVISGLLATHIQPIWLDGAVTTRQAVAATGEDVQWDETQGKLMRISHAPLSAEEIWATKLGGFLTVNGIDLKANRSAKNDFTGMFTLLAAGVQAGVLTAQTPVDIWDAHEAKHTLLASDALALLLAYGFAWQSMFNEFAP